MSFAFILGFSAATCFIALIAFLLGKKIGVLWGKEARIEEEKQFRKELTHLDLGKKELQKNLEMLKQQNEKYLSFLVRLPDAVKHLNSTLSFDELVSFIIRVTKDLIDTDTVELYIFNKTTQCLDLVAAFGSDKKKSLSLRLGEGVIGGIASTKTLTSREQIGRNLPAGQIEFGIPMLFKNNLMGVIGIGKIRPQTGNEKRFLAMVADLSAVALQNCEYMTTAKEEAITDALTGLYNKRHFLDRSLEAAQKAISYNSPLSIFIFDIDHFKNYNDKNGHVQGDVLLKELSRLLKENTRTADTVARYGGEEFIVLLPNTAKENAFLYAEKIRKLIESRTFQFRERQPLGFVSVSGGIATFPTDGNSIEAVIKNADKALYDSKAGGRNRITKFEPTRLSDEDNENAALTKNP